MSADSHPATRFSYTSHQPDARRASQESNKPTRIARLVALVALLLLGIRFVIGEPASEATASAIMVTPPTEQELFGDMLIPYSGMGAVWIRPDGLVVIEAEDGDGTAFSIQTASLCLVQVAGERVEFRHESQTESPGVEVLHAFPSPPRSAEQGRTCSAVYRHVGDLSIDYDEQTGVLLIEVIGGREIFAAEFNLSLMSEPTGLSGGSCECSYYGPPGGSCSASKTCPEGQECSCKCGQNGCKCSSCRRARGADVEVLY